MDGDIFSDDHQSLDTSDIDDRWEPVTDGPDVAVAEHDADLEVEDEEVIDDADDEEIVDEPVVEEQPPADDEPDPSAFVMPAELEGKSAEDIAKMFVDSRKMVGSQSNEVSELRRITSEQADQIRELLGYLQQGPTQQPEPVDTSSIVAEALDNPQAAYQQAVSLVDQGLATPDLVEDIIEAVADIAPRLSRQMTADFSRRLTTAQLRSEFKQELDERVAPLQQHDYQSQLNIATSSLYADPVLGEDAKAYEAEIVALLAEKDDKGNVKPIGRNAQEIRARIESALTVARGQDPTKSSAYKKALAELKGDAQTDPGNPPGAAPKKKSEADAYRESVFARKSERDPGAALFA